MFQHPGDTIVGGWDIEPLYKLGYTIPVEFGNGSKLGTGLGAYTVQHSYGGVPHCYYAGSVNYALWGRMFSLLHYTFRQPLTGSGDPIYSETAAVAAARGFKALGHFDFFNKYATEAGAFVRFGYSGKDPSSTALPLPQNPSNIAAPTRFLWKWVGLRDDFE